MRRLLFCCAAVLLTSLAKANAVPPVSTTVCEIVKSPASFNNRFVRVRATVLSGFEMSALRDPEIEDCRGIWFEYSEASRRGFAEGHLSEDRSFKKFQEALSAVIYPRLQGHYCMGCPRYEVTAVLTGLIQYAATGLGFGHLNGSRIQFVLESVQEISLKDLAVNYDRNEFSTEPVKFPAVGSAAYFSTQAVNRFLARI